MIAMIRLPIFAFPPFFIAFAQFANAFPSDRTKIVFREYKTKKFSNSYFFVPIRRRSIYRKPTQLPSSITPFVRFAKNTHFVNRTDPSQLLRNFTKTMAQLVHLFLLFASVLAQEQLVFPKVPYEQKVKNMCPIQQACKGETLMNCTEAICFRDLRNDSSLSATACCTSGFKMKCCAKLSSAIKWKPKKLATLLKKMDKKKECQNEENYCFCDVTKHNQGMGIAGVCCGDADCNCCPKDEFMEKLPVLNVMAKYDMHCEDTEQELRVKREKNKRVGMCMSNEVSVEHIWNHWDEAKTVRTTTSCEHAERMWFWVATAMVDQHDQHERRTNNSGSGFPSSSAFLMILMEALILAPIY
ncbi:hypothetical protein niasHS_002045 [Heterodera schachtii]|uniref:Uncharacterized protein n=1 Tax=Heterodera schachtii TaxID=97005 RepID=A0ABD2K600_HETSC